MSYALTDSMTMLRRSLRHALRYPGMTVSVVTQPVLIMVLFVYVFGGAIGTSLGGGDYLNYVVPGILLMTMGTASLPVAVAVCTDMAEGVVARFRTMPISRASVLTGHVLGSVIQTMITVALAIGFSLLLGFRPEADFVGWLGVAGVVAMVTFAIIWLGVALGLVAKAPEGASTLVLPISLLLPFLSSAFVPLDSMPGWVRAFAENQPFTPIIETLRGLLNGTPIGDNGWIAAAWCAGIALAGYVWAKALFNRDPSR